MAVGAASGRQGVGSHAEDGTVGHRRAERRTKKVKGHGNGSIEFGFAVAGAEPDAGRASERANGRRDGVEDAVHGGPLTGRMRIRVLTRRP